MRRPNRSKRYLEFAADNRIDAVLIGRSEGRETRNSARRSDCCGPYRDFDIAAIAGYARDLGIELIGCRGTDDCVSGCGRQLDSALMRYAGLGMHNLMTDFFRGRSPTVAPAAANTACVIAGGSSRRRPGTA